MKMLLCAAVGLASAFLTVPAEARAKRFDYVLVNRSAKSVRVEFIGSEGKFAGSKTVEPQHEITLRGNRRIVVHTEQQTREYALPAILYVPTKPGATKKFEAMSSGKWRVVVTEAPHLDITYHGGGTIEEMPDYTKRPLLFPLRPRKTSETFEQYEDALRQQKREALLK